MTNLHCPNCGYSLRGNLSGQCPECGERATSRDISQRLDFLRHRKYRSLRLVIGLVAVQSIAFLAMCHFMPLEYPAKPLFFPFGLVFLIFSFIASVNHGVDCAIFAAFDDFVTRGEKPSPVKRVPVAGAFFLFPMIIQCGFLLLGFLMVLGRMNAWS